MEISPSTDDERISKVYEDKKFLTVTMMYILYKCTQYQIWDDSKKEDYVFVTVYAQFILTFAYFFYNFKKFSFSLLITVSSQMPNTTRQHLEVEVIN